MPATANGVLAACVELQGWGISDTATDNEITSQTKGTKFGADFGRMRGLRNNGTLIGGNGLRVSPGLT